MSLEEWSTDQGPQLTLREMDALVEKLRQDKEQYEEAKAKADALYHEYENQRKVVLDALKSQGKDKYEVAGVGLVYVSSKEVYRVPGTNEDKTKLFNYIKEKYGPDSLMSMVSINHQTLNSFANKESDTGVMAIPGLDAPTVQETIGLRRK